VAGLRVIVWLFSWVDLSVAILLAHRGGTLVGAAAEYELKDAEERLLVETWERYYWA